MLKKLIIIMSLIAINLSTQTCQLNNNFTQTNNYGSCIINPLLTEQKADSIAKMVRLEKTLEDVETLTKNTNCCCSPRTFFTASSTLDRESKAAIDPSIKSFQGTEDKWVSRDLGYISRDFRYGAFSTCVLCLPCFHPCGIHNNFKKTKKLTQAQLACKQSQLIGRVDQKLQAAHNNYKFNTENYSCE